MGCRVLKGLRVEYATQAGCKVSEGPGLRRSSFPLELIRQAPTRPPPLVLTMTDAPPFVLDQAPEHCLPGSKCAACPGSSGADRATRIGGGDEEGQEEPARRMGLTERPDGSL